jgi:Cu/Ag efflux protein CusF
MNAARILVTGCSAALLALGGVAHGQGSPSSSSSQGKMGSDQSSQGPSSSAQSSQNLRSMTLTVKEADSANKTVTFQAPVRSDASITQHGQPISLDQLKEGDQVRASFDPATGDLVNVQVVKSASESGSSMGSGSSEGSSPSSNQPSGY